MRSSIGIPTIRPCVRSSSTFRTRRNASSEDTKRLHNHQEFRRAEHFPSRRLPRRQRKTFIVLGSGSGVSQAFATAPSTCSTGTHSQDTYSPVTALNENVALKLKDIGLVQRYRTCSAAWAKQQVEAFNKTTRLQGQSKLQHTNLKAATYIFHEHNQRRHATQNITG